VRLYTIGHGNLEIDPFIEILRSSGVAWVADVRSSPYSRMFRWFNKVELSATLEDAGIRYVFLGSKLGGKPRDYEAPDVWRQGRLNQQLVSTLSTTPRWQQGIKCLAQLVAAGDETGEDGCLLCSEKDPNNCHRSLIAFNAEEALPGLSVVHLGHHSEMREAKFQEPLFRGGVDERSDYH
jgi:uncharacterized protein (DUF488 family)